MREVSRYQVEFHAIKTEMELLQAKFNQEINIKKQKYKGKLENMKMQVADT